MLKFAIERGVILSVAILILCLFGVVAIFTVPVQMTPEVSSTVISVRTSWPGATPQDVEKEILIEQEKYLRRLSNLQKMTSEATTGSAQVELEFDLNMDLQEALIRVNNALSQVPAYPENVDQPRLYTNSSTDSPFIFNSIRVRPDAVRDIDLYMELDFLEDNVITEIERIEGVSEVEVRGGTHRQIQIYIDPSELAKRQISITELRDAMRSRNRDVSGGDIGSGKRRYLIRTLGRYESIEDIANTIIARRDGVLIRLKDVGYAELGHEEERSRSYYNGERTLTVSLKRQIGANVVEIKENLLVLIERLNNGILKRRGLMMEQYADDVVYVKKSISVVQKNLLFGGLLACLILYLFLRSIYLTILGALGVPICTIGAFLGLLVMGRTLNVVSLAGVAFAIGMTLDNSIVVLENIQRHRAMGKNGYRAALDGAQEVWKAVLASTLTTIFVFLPIMLIREEAGQLYSDIAIAVSAAIIMSMLVAVTVIPSASVRLFGHPVSHFSLLDRLVEFGQRFQRRTLQFVEWLMGGYRRRLVLVGSVLCVCLSVMLFFTPRAEYLPEGEESKIFARMLPPQGYNLEEMDRVSAEIEKELLPYIGADSGAYDRGETSIPPLKYIMRAPSNGSLFSLVVPVSDNPEQAQALQRMLTERYRQVPGMIGFANRGSIFSGNSGGSRGIELSIKGPDLATVYDTALKVFLRAQELLVDPQIRPVPGLSLSQPSIEVHPDWNRAAELGIDTQDLGYLIWVLSDGAYMDEFFLGDDKIDMFLYSTQGTVKQSQDIAQLSVYSSRGGVVPLSALAEVRETVNTETIRRIDGERTISLQIVPPRSIALEEAVEMVEAELIAGMHAKGEIPDDIGLAITGASDKLKATREALSNNLIIAVLLSYLLMTAIFSHWGYPLLILLNIPLGISGGIIGLWVMNGLLGIRVPFDMITMLGVVVLIGTVVNNPILLVEQARGFMRQGMEPVRAVVESVRIRLRPIMMSMLTTIFGLSPIVFLSGAGTELYRGLGTIVMFGLLFSTLITLTFMPSLLSLILEAGERLKIKWGKSARSTSP